MPDSISGISGLRPVVRRVSVTQKDLINRFERSGSSTSSSVSNSGSNTPTSLVSRSRAGSLKKTSAPKSPKTSTTDSTAVTPRVKTEVSFGFFFSSSKVVPFLSCHVVILLSFANQKEEDFQEDAESPSSRAFLIRFCIQIIVFIKPYSWSNAGPDSDCHSTSALKPVLSIVANDNYFVRSIQFLLIKMLHMLCYISGFH